MRGFERLGDELFATRGGPAGGAEVLAAVVQRLVHDVPRGDASAVARHLGFDVAPHAVEEHFAAGRLVAVAEEPPGGTVVLGPDEAMADDVQVVPAGEVDEGVGLCEVPLSFGPLDLRRLHAVLRRHGAELRQQEAVVRHALGNAVVDADADVEQVLGRFLERRVGRLIGGPDPDGAGR